MRNKKNRHKTKDLISLGLYSLMLKHPYDEISVKDICLKAGVSRMSFYRYYNKKDDIFVDYCDERFEDFYTEMSNSPNLDLRVFTLEMFRYIKKYQRQINVLISAKKEFLFLDQLNSYARYIISNLNSPYLKEQKNNPVFAFFMAGGLFNVIMFWIQNDMKPTPEQMNDLLYQITDVKI